MKRLFREAFRQNKTRIPASDIIVRPADACREANVEALGRMLVLAANESMDKRGDR